MADEELVAELANVIHAHHCGCELEAEPGGDYRNAARAVLAWLAERGRLVPDGALVEEQWRTTCHADGSDGIRRSSGDAFASRRQAEKWGQEMVGQYGITRYTLHRREVRRWPDGSFGAGPWVAVAEETT